MQLSLQTMFKLNGDVEIPLLGLGVWQSPPGKATRDAVRFALESEYRLIDTARIYGNEDDVGVAVREAGLPREEIFVTTKVWNSDQGYDSTIRACEESLRRLGLDYLDLYLVHWPVEDLRVMFPLGKNSVKGPIRRNQLRSSYPLVFSSVVAKGLRFRVPHWRSAVEKSGALVRGRGGVRGLRM